MSDKKRHKIKINTSVFPQGEIIIETSLFDQKMMELVSTKEDHVRRALIELGWTPPPADQPEERKFQDICQLFGVTPAPEEESPDFNADDRDPQLAALSEKYVWSIGGRGLSTSLGVQTRRLIGEAFRAGYRAATLIVEAGKALSAPAVPSIEALRVIPMKKGFNADQASGFYAALDLMEGKKTVEDIALTAPVPDEAPLAMDVGEKCVVCRRINCTGGGEPHKARSNRLSDAPPVPPTVDYSINKELYQDVFEWAAYHGVTLLETEIGDLIDIVEKHRNLLRPVDQREDYWKPISEIDKEEGKHRIVWIEHNPALGHKPEYSHATIAYWTNHNGGGWVWNGLAGIITHYLPQDKIHGPMRKILKGE